MPSEAPQSPAAGPQGPDLSGPAPADLDIFSVLQALSDPVRAHIVCLLDARDTEIPIGGFGLAHLPKSSCSYHFKVLREAGLIAQRTAGNRRMNRLRRADLEQRFPGLLDTVLTAYRTAERSEAEHR
ncbi:ArsR/SmtB family transcription factor [Streptomyces sp. G45]|uniref:ArsR/SmtB family transcription factor n=1 Tax=Streptomyces sp. G45 TaxID=3406627 RepID=UPI003C14A3AA